MSVKKIKRSIKFDKKRKIIIASLSVLAIVVSATLVLVFSASPISGSNLFVNFTDESGQSLESHGIYVQPGSREIVGWNDLGTEELSDNLVRYNSLVKARVTVNFYTKTTAKNAYTNTNVINKEVPYVTIEKCINPNIKSSYKGANTYKAYYDDYDLTELKDTAKGYDGKVIFDATIQEIGAENISRNGIKIQTDQLTSITQKITVVDSTSQEIGQYSDFYTSDLTGGSNSFISISHDYPSSYDSKWREPPTVGLFPSYNLESENTKLGQVGSYELPTIGQDYIVQNGFQMTLVPGISVTHQEMSLIQNDYILIDIEKNDWDTRFGFISEKSGNTATKPLERIVSWHVTNYQIQVTFEIEFKLSSTVNFEIDDTEAYDLEDVKLYYQDHYWQSTLNGETVSIPVKDKSYSELWWEQNYLTVIIVAIVALAIIYIVIKIRYGGVSSLLGSGRSGSTSIKVGKVSYRKSN
jgi:hypothetical protein